MAISRANSLKSSVRDTKSVSHNSSTKAPSWPLAWRYTSISPWFVSLVGSLGPRMPFSLSTASAFATLPSASTSAFRQSIIPAPVRSRNSFTSCALISMNVFSPLRQSARAPSNNPPRRIQRVLFDVSSVVCLFGGYRRLGGRRRRHLGFVQDSRRGGRRRGCRLIVFIGIGREAQPLRGKRGRFNIGKCRLPRLLTLDDGVRDLAGQETNGPNRVVIG